MIWRVKNWFWHWFLCRDQRSSEAPDVGNVRRGWWSSTRLHHLCLYGKGDQQPEEPCRSKASVWSDVPVPHVQRLPSQNLANSAGPYEERTWDHTIQAVELRNKKSLHYLHWKEHYRLNCVFCQNWMIELRTRWCWFRMNLANPAGGASTVENSGWKRQNANDMLSHTSRPPVSHATSVPLSTCSRIGQVWMLICWLGTKGKGKLTVVNSLIVYFRCQRIHAGALNWGGLAVHCLC